MSDGCLLQNMNLTFEEANEYLRIQLSFLSSRGLEEMIHFYRGVMGVASMFTASRKEMKID